MRMQKVRPFWALKDFLFGADLTLRKGCTGIAYVPNHFAAKVLAAGDLHGHPHLGFLHSLF